MPSAICPAREYSFSVNLEVGNAASPIPESVMAILTQTCQLFLTGLSLPVTLVIKILSLLQLMHFSCGRPVYEWECWGSSKDPNPWLVILV